MNEEKQSVQVTADNNSAPDTADKIKVSVIVPVYKDEKYIERCLYSLLNQSLKEIEFIFIDDCGGDNSISIVEKEAASDNRIRIIYNEKNIGAGLSRNIGIESAHGEYLGFVDADDEVDLNFYEKLYALAVKYNSDVSKGQRVNYLLNGTNQKGVLTDRLSEFGEYAERQDWFFYFDFEHQTAIYRHDLIKKENIRYSNTLVAEDTMFLLQMMYYAHKVAFCHEAYYHYYIRKGSLSTTRSESFHEANIQNFNERIKFLSNHHAEKDIVVQYIQRLVDHLLMLYQSIIGADNNRIRYNYLCGIENALDHFIYKDQLSEHFNKITEYKNALVQVQNVGGNQKMRKNWALVTGAVRSELYLRIIMVKLCDMRAKGRLEGIVLSTWKGEIAPDSILKNQLTNLGIKIVETAALDINAEIMNNVPGLERQRMLIDNGLKIIPFGSFVLKLRTDFNSDIRDLFDLLDQKHYDDDTLEYGKFPVNFRHKIYVKNYFAKHIFYPNDRFFYGQREDLEKLMVPVSYSKLVNFHYDIEVELVAGYAFYTYPILRKTVDLLKPEFYEQYLFPYCKKMENSELKIPRILLRAYATIFVYVYTHFKFLTDKTVEPDKCPLISIKDIFSGNINNGYQIKKIIFGEVVDSPSMKEFQKELLNISLNKFEPDIYSYEEYLELKEFVDKEIGHPELISEYPIVSLSRSVLNESSGDILLSPYDDPRVTEIIQMAKNFNSVSEIYNKVKNSDLNQLNKDLICASIYDRGDNQAMNAYYIALLDNKITEDETFNQCIRYQIIFSIRINCADKDLVYVNFFLALLYCKKKSYKKVYDNLVRQFPKRSYGKRIQYKSSGEGNAEFDLIKLLIKYAKENRYDGYNVYIKKALCSILYFSKKYNVALNLTTDETLTSISCIQNNLNCYSTSDEMRKILYALVDDFNVDTYLLEKNDDLSMEGLFDLSNILLMKNSFFSNCDLLVDTFGENLTNSALLESFMYCAKNTTVRLFSLKFGNEIWFNYIPFCESEWNKLLDIPKNKQGQFWPCSENQSGSAYAAYIKIVDNAVFISIEFCSEPGPVKNNLFANAKLIGVDNFDANSQIIRLKVNKFPFKNNEEMGTAIGLALDEFSRIGDMLKATPLE